MKIIPAPKLDKPGEERWPDNSLESDYNQGSNNQRSPTYSDHHHSSSSDDNTDNQYNNQHGSPSSVNDPNTITPAPPKKRTRPVIRIKAERPPIRINSVGQIKLKAERQMRLKPKIRYMDKNKELPIDTNTSNNNDDDDSYEKQPEQSSINPRVHHHNRGHKKIMTAYSNGPTRSKVIPDKYLQDMPPLRNLDDINPRTIPPHSSSGKKYTPSSSSYDQLPRHNYKNNHKSIMKSTSSTSGHHNSRSKSTLSTDDGDNNKSALDFSPIYRPSSSSSSKPSSSYSDNDSSGEESGSGSKSAGHRPMTIRTSEGLEQLEKNNYDKQLLKTLKKTMKKSFFWVHFFQLISFTVTIEIH